MTTTTTTSAVVENGVGPTETTNDDAHFRIVPRRRPRPKPSKLKRLLRRLPLPLLALTVPYFVGLLWTSIHPLVSVVTGELKCRGHFVDESGLDVNHHRTPSYPTERRFVVTGEGGRRRRDDDDGFGGQGEGGLCEALASLTSERGERIAPGAECLSNMGGGGGGASFDVARVLPSLGPVSVPGEAIALIVGTEYEDDGEHAHEREHRHGRENWYESSDFQASVVELVDRLSRREDCPWLSKVVYVVAAPSSKSKPKPKLSAIAKSFVESYTGGEGLHLPPDFASPLLRVVLVLRDVAERNKNTTATTTAKKNTRVRVLPQGASGSLPNLDLVFATMRSFHATPEHESETLVGGGAEFRVHDFRPADAWEERGVRFAGKAAGWAWERLVQLPPSVMDFGKKNFRWTERKTRDGFETYARDFAGYAGFVASMALGPATPHAHALARGIDALTIELRVPPSSPPSPSAIHPHRADLLRVTEHLLRAASNLHERLHHSVTQYVMPAPMKFIGHGEYIYPAILVALPMVVGAVTAAFRDVGTFRAGHVAGIVGAVIAGTCWIGFWAGRFDDRDGGDHAGGGGRGGGGWNIGALAAHSLAYAAVIYAARRRRRRHPGPGGGGGTGGGVDDDRDARASLRFAACLLGVYLHAPLLMSHYPLGFPSAVFWSPLLAWTTVPPPLPKPQSKPEPEKKGTTVPRRDKREREPAGTSMALGLKNIIATIFVGTILFATCPPVLLVPCVFPSYSASSYVLGVYVPLHLLLAAMWLS